MRRRTFLTAALAANAAGADSQTLRFKTAGGLPLFADFYSASTPNAPVAVWLHGGALILGTRRLSPQSPILQSLREAGFAVVSFDYRLAPETKLPAIIDDIRDAFAWLRSQGKSLGIDAGRIVVCGGSAGGYLTLMTGFRISPRPRALVAYWGYGDIIGNWYSKPDAFYRKQPLVTREEAVAAVGAQPVADPPAGNNRGRFYLYCRQNGLWPKEVAGRDPVADAPWFRQYCPIQNVTKEYPPTLLIHGDADTDVPHEQSVQMEARLKSTGVRHEFLSIRGGGHGLGNIAREEQARLYSHAARFLKESL